ncbi:MAG: hypothetical protein WBD40_06830 [Tepidisphaeraceae bacterium]
MTERGVPDEAVSYREGDTPLTLPGLALVGVKLIGLYLIVRVISAVVTMPLYLSGFGSRTVYMLAGLMPHAVDVAIGIVLLWKAEWVVSRIVRVPADEAPSISANEHFQGIAFSVLGVILIVWALADVASLIATFAENQAFRNAGGIVPELGFGSLVQPIVLAAAGVVLFLRGRGLAALWHRMRYGGVRVREVE